jgi:heme-degrading monooxygenase HmoA
LGAIILVIGSRPLGAAEGEKVHARVANIRFPSGVRDEVVRVGSGLTAILRSQRGFKGLQVLTHPEAGEGMIVSLWETESDAEASEATPSYIGQMSMMSSFLYEPLAPETYEVGVHV